MATYSFVDTTDTTVKLVEDSVEIIYKKVYCSTAVDGDNVMFFAHELETGKLRQQYIFDYTDCVAPVALSAALLKVAIDAIIENYAGGGTGTGDVVGPASSVDDNIVTFDGLTGKLIQDSGVAISSLQSVNKIMALIAAY